MKVLLNRNATPRFICCSCAAKFATITAKELKASAYWIGNLTLVSQALNPSLSNSAWAGTDQKPGELEALKKHAIMHMNRRLLDQFREHWSEETIATRAASLFEDARLIWQR